METVYVEKLPSEVYLENTRDLFLFFPGIHLANMLNIAY